ncbi:hypothetical protein ACP4OV_020350 [Aristida adscensionis]
MVNERQLTNIHEHDLHQNIENGNTANLQWNCYGDEMDALLAAHDDAEEEQDSHPGSETSSSKRKRFHVNQIQELEALFHECSHPGEKARKAIAEKIGLEPMQVKFWFQNRRSKMNAPGTKNRLVREEMDALLDEKELLQKAIQDRNCSACAMNMPPSSSSLEHLISDKVSLMNEYQHAMAMLTQLSPDAALALAVPDAGVGPAVLLAHAECAMNEFERLATKGFPLWEAIIDAEVLNFEEYRCGVFPRLFEPSPEQFAVEATKKSSLVRGSAKELVAILTDPDCWSKMFPDLVAFSNADTIVVSGGALDPHNGLIQLMTAELWAVTPRLPYRRVKFLRFSKLTASGQWAVMDVSVDGIRGQQEAGVEQAGVTSCRLLPSGCLIQDMSSGYCKVTWIVHAEYDETAMPPLYRKLFAAGQALGARRWLMSLQKRCEYLAALESNEMLRMDDKPILVEGRRAILQLAERMTESFFLTVSGPATAMASSNVNINEWRATSVTERFEVVVRMVTWRTAAGPMPGGPGVLVMSGTTTVWLPNTPPYRVSSYLSDRSRRGEWDALANNAPMLEVGSIATGTGFLHRNAVSILRPSVIDATNFNTLILQEVSVNTSCSLVVYSPIVEEMMHVVMGGSDHTSIFLLPSGFAIFPDGHGNQARRTAAASALPSTSRARTCYDNNITGTLLTVSSQMLLPGSSPDYPGAIAFDTMGKRLCHMIEKIKIAMKAEPIVAA